MKLKSVSSLSLVLCFLMLGSCSKDKTIVITSRSYNMGMANSAPRYDDINLVVETLDLWTSRADAAIISVSVPWDSLYAGVSPEDYILRNYSSIVDYYRSKNLKLWIYIDPANGLDRSAEDDQLVAMGKSIIQMDVQQKYRDFARAMNSMLVPEHLGLALETNLIRAASSPNVYNAIKNAVNDAATDIRASGSTVKLSVSIQAEVAWGKTTLTPDHNYVGIEQDFIDFPFVQELGISSYPYFDFSTPEELPDNYYSKLVEGTEFGIFISEGGWTSESFDEADNTHVTSTPDLQRRYIVRQGQLLANAPSIALFQLTFTDLDLTAIPDGAGLRYFATLGLVDTELIPRPSLAAWDDLYKLQYKE